jgi:thymidylate synthase (FAD)
VIAKACLEEYQYLIDSGFAPEEARMVLPLNTMTEWVWSGTLGAWLDMLKLRLKPDTQGETRVVASYIALEVKKLFPISTEARLDL